MDESPRVANKCYLFMHTFADLRPKPILDKLLQDSGLGSLCDFWSTVPKGSGKRQNVHFSFVPLERGLGFIEEIKQNGTAKLIYLQGNSEKSEKFWIVKLDNLIYKPDPFPQTDIVLAPHPPMTSVLIERSGKRARGYDQPPQLPDQQRHCSYEAFMELKDYAVKLEHAIDTLTKENGELIAKINTFY